MRRLFKKWLPDHAKLHANQSTQWVAAWLKEHRYLWRLHRHSVAKGAAAGLLVAFIPLPAQILLASILVLLLRGNLPVAIVMTLISNPFTFLPINFLILHIGAFLVGADVSSYSLPDMDNMEFNFVSIPLFFEVMFAWMQNLGKTFLVGLVVLSFGSALLGFTLIHVLWRFSILFHLHKRKKRKNHKR